MHLLFYHEVAVFLMKSICPMLVCEDSIRNEDPLFPYEVPLFPLSPPTLFPWHISHPRGHFSHPHYSNSASLKLLLSLVRSAYLSPMCVALPRKAPLTLYTRLFSLLPPQNPFPSNASMLHVQVFSFEAWMRCQCFLFDVSHFWLQD